MSRKPDGTAGRMVRRTWTRRTSETGNVPDCGEDAAQGTGGTPGEVQGETRPTVAHLHGLQGDRRGGLLDEPGRDRRRGTSGGEVQGETSRTAADGCDTFTGWPEIGTR